MEGREIKQIYLALPKPTGRLNLAQRRQNKV